MEKPRVIIADTDINYIVPLQLKFIRDYFDKIDLEIITDKEFDFFKYEVERILMNQQVQDYFYNLYYFSKKFPDLFPRICIHRIFKNITYQIYF